MLTLRNPPICSICLKIARHSKVNSCAKLNTFSHCKTNSGSWMTYWLHLTLLGVLGVGVTLGFPSLECPESSSSRWCEVHSNQQKWPQMVSSSPRVDGWTVGKFASFTQKGLQGPDAICGQDVGGTQWWTWMPSRLQCLPGLTYNRYFQAPKKLLASSWLPYNGRIMWQLGVPIWETQVAASSSDDILIRLIFMISDTICPPQKVYVLILLYFYLILRQQMQRGH